MKHEVTSYQTKKLLGDALKRAMEQKPFSGITISALIRDCGVNRKTFYYHFQDLYALLGWVLNEEAIGVVRRFHLLKDYEEAIRFVMDYVENNRYLAGCLCDTAALAEAKRFFFTDFLGVTLSAIEEAETEKGLWLEPEFKTFVARFYTEALAGMIIDWAVNQKCRDKEQVIAGLTRIMAANIDTLLAQMERLPKP